MGGGELNPGGREVRQVRRRRAGGGQTQQRGIRPVLASTRHDAPQSEGEARDLPRHAEDRSRGDTKGHPRSAYGGSGRTDRNVGIIRPPRACRVCQRSCSVVQRSVRRDSPHRCRNHPDGTDEIRDPEGTRRVPATGRCAPSLLSDSVRAVGQEGTRDHPQDHMEGHTG